MNFEISYENCFINELRSYLVFTFKKNHIIGECNVLLKMVGHFFIFSLILVSLDEIIHFQKVECRKYRNKKEKPKKIVITENQKVVIFDLG